MSNGRHRLNNPNKSNVDPQWSGVSFAPKVEGYKCPKCGGHLHNEADNHYCPFCDDYVRGVKGTPDF